MPWPEQVPIHDWTLEETLSGVVMQAELLVINRNVSGIAWNLPRFLRTFNLIEGRRDFATGGLLFLSGPSSNLLAPSFGGWQLVCHTGNLLSCHSFLHTKLTSRLGTGQRQARMVLYDGGVGDLRSRIDSGDRVRQARPGSANLDAR